jgi:protein PsiE
MHAQMNRIGSALVDGFHFLALFAIGGAIVWSAAHAFLGMVGKGAAGIDDILLLFIYLELGAMVGIYFKTNHMPVRFLIYVAMTAITRMMIGDVGQHRPAQWEILTLSGAILLLALATLVVRYGSAKYPSSSP